MMIVAGRKNYNYQIFHFPFFCKYVKNQGGRATVGKYTKMSPKNVFWKEKKMTNEDLIFSLKWHILTFSALSEQNTESSNSYCF